MSARLQARDLSLTIGGKSILRSISFALSAGKTLGLVGESGSGKSMTALSLLGLLPPGARLRGSLLLDGEELVGRDEAFLCSLRGRDISMAFQEPMSALNPLLPIGDQVAEVFRQHQKIDKAEALAKAAAVLERVELPNTQFPLSRYPFELSGGQRQRVVIAIALALKPKVLIADEPTTALDVTTEARILDLLQSLCAEDAVALLFVSHDLAAVTRLADEIAVMKDGEIVETGSSHDFFSAMHHPYSIALRDASIVERTDVDVAATDGADESLLEVRDLCRDYVLPRTQFWRAPERFRAVDNVSFRLYRGQNVGLVGESGSGKSTLVRAMLGLETLQGGEVRLNGEIFWPSAGGLQRRLRRQIQVVFQDPFGSFNPRHRIERIVSEPLHLLDRSVNSNERRERVVEVLENVGLSADDRLKFAHEFSGGQRQRIAIARALVVSPSIVVLDEATSALDVSVRAQLLELLAHLSRQLGISYVFVSHDLDVVRAVTDYVLIMKSGKIVEQGATAQLFANPEHPYTQSLLNAKPTLQEEIQRRQTREETHAQ